LRRLGLEKYEERLRKEEVDLQEMRVLRLAEWRELGIPVGPRSKILRELGRGTASGVEGGYEELKYRVDSLCTLILDDEAERDELKKVAVGLKRML